VIDNAIKYDGAGPYMVRDPRSRLPVSIDWSAWLTQEGTTITSSIWTGVGLTLESEAHSPTTTSVIVSGGTLAQSYELRNTITCANGYIDSRSLRLRVKDR
jgi:hypothetical protein